MKKILIGLILMALITPLFAQTGTVVVNITGINNNTGLVQVGLYNDEEKFPDIGDYYKHIVPKANKAGVSVTFKDVPAGTYAIATWHDEDEDLTMNKNLFGSPKESYGFSKNIYGNFGPPDFEEVSFKVTEGKSIILDIILE